MLSALCVFFDPQISEPISDADFEACGSEASPTNPILRHPSFPVLMGKKIKKKPRTGQKERRASTNSSKNESETSNETGEAVDKEEALSVKERNPCSCSHLEKGIDLTALSTKFASFEGDRCEDCREAAGDRRGGKGKGAKPGKKKGSGVGDPKSADSKAVWVCLACGHLACGGVGLPTSHNCHALRHARQTRHPIVVQLEKPQLRWCFTCKSLVRGAEKTEEENGESNDVFFEAVKLIQGCPEEGSSAGLGSESNGLVEVRGGRAVRGLANLGNTCFFNSVLQNLLAMDPLRGHFLNSDGVPVGPLSMAFKKIYAETQPEAGLKNNVINPRGFFGCICSKAPQFKGYQQHDSHELLRCLLDVWSSEELGALKRGNSSKDNGDSPSPVPTFVDAVFGGQVSSTVCCTECGHSSTVYEPFLDLSLPVPTKKPISKKAQQNTRSKKQKLPPKRVVKNRPKISKPVPERSSSSRESQLSSDGPTMPTVENCSSEQNSGAITESGTNEAVKGEVEQTSVSLDECTDSWLDFVDLESPTIEYDHVPSTVVDSVFQGPEEEKPMNNTVVDDVPLISGTGSEDKNSLLDDVPALIGTEAEAQVFPQNEVLSDQMPHYSSVNPWEDEIPMQVQNSEVLLLPYIEVGEGEASSGILDDGQEEFDGLGDLFNEPEIISSGQMIGPSVNEDVTLTGFMATHSSESDPDEVDNSDSPVSVETCLSHFTKSELLSDENAWHCESCSKAHRGQKREANKQPKAPFKTSVNGCGTGTTNDIAILDKNTSLAEAEPRNENGSIERVSDSDKLDMTINESGQDHIEKENGEMDSRGEPQNIEMKDEVRVQVQEQEQEQSNFSGPSYLSCREESLSERAIDSGCGDEEGESKLSNANHEHEDIEDKSETVKLRRDATKRVLIKKAPQILTIHLKRFSQDARGRLSKLNGHVAFREIVDIKPYMDARSVGGERFEYRLVGVVEHQGTMRGGHYVAYVRGKGGKRNNDASTWFHASDAYVRETNLGEVLQSEAYILFYEKV